MEKTNIGKSLAFGLSLTVLAGCAGSGGTQEPVAEEQVTAEPTVTSDMGAEAQGTGGDSAVNGEALGSVDTMEPMEEETLAEQAEAAMPSIMTVYFDFDKSAVKPDERDVLDMHAEYLTLNPAEQVVLEGHADERGTREYNMALGERRAKAVMRYLTVQGVAPSQMEVVSFGEERPAEMGHSESAWSKNRRVEIQY